MNAYSVSFTPEAETEALHAYFWYENQRGGLGEEFKLYLDIKIDSLKSNPKTSSYIYKNLRTCKVKKFPYQIIYRIQELQIQVIAVFHYSRNPKEWRKRI